MGQHVVSANADARLSVNCRQAWVGGALLPQSSTPPLTPTLPLTEAQDLQQSAQLLAEEELPPDSQLAAAPAAASQHGTSFQLDVSRGTSHGLTHGASHGKSHGILIRHCPLHPHQLQ